jgi:DNA repair photolyase
LYERDTVFESPPNKKQVRLAKGRGAVSNPDSRYLAFTHEAVDDDGVADAEPARAPKTSVTLERARSIISHNQSPDVPFEQSINPYRGCEHGCSYCFARPTHAYIGLSPGTDFETRIFAKPDAANLLRQALRRKGYVCRTIALGTNTDPYQPIERKLRITRDILQLLHDCDHPVSITTKSSLVERDIDLLSAMAAKGLAQVQISVTTLDKPLSRLMEPRAASPQRRLETIGRLSQAGIPVGVMLAPVIPFLTDAEMETILARSAAAGATWSAYVMLRLPLEVKDLFEEWLQTYFPLKAKHVMSRMREMREGKAYDSAFGARQTGTGVFAQMIRQRFRLAQKQSGSQQTFGALNTNLFRPPALDSGQLSLF